MSPFLIISARNGLLIAFLISTFTGCRQDFQNQFGTKSLSGHNSTATTDKRIYIRLPLPLVTANFTARTGFIRDHIRDDLFAFGYLEPQKLDVLTDAEFATMLELDAHSWSEHDFDAKTLELREDTVGDARELTEEYHDYAALTAELTNLSQTYPMITALHSAGKSVEGRELWYLRISDHIDQDEHEPKLLFVANMHGDEVVGRELMIYLARKLLNNYGSDPRITALVNQAEVFILPSMNPDGFENESRFNADNVDLNRDFPDFTSDPHNGPTGRAPETQALMALHEHNQFALALNFHGGDTCFNLPWDTRDNDSLAGRFADDRLIKTLGRRYANSNATMVQNNGDSFDHGLTYGYEWYEVDGGLQDYANYYENSTHATVELGRQKWPAPATLGRYWNENEEPLLNFLEQGVKGFFLSVKGSDGATALTVQLTDGGRHLTYPNGLVLRPQIEPATITLSAQGYQPRTVNLSPRPFADHFDQIVLQKD